MARPVVVNFIGDARKLNRTVDEVKGKLSGVHKAVGLLAGLGIGTALVGGLKSVIDAGKESQAVSRETEARLRAMGNGAHISAKGIADLAEAISNKTGKDDEAIQSGANMLLSFKNIRNEVGAGNDIFNQATAVATDMAAKFGGDASKNALKLGKALNDPIKGITSLSRIGVSFSAQQQQQIRDFVRVGDVASAQKIILEEVGKKTAGAAAASTTGWDKFLVKVDNIKEDIGEKLLPVMDQLASKLMKGIDFVGKHATAFKILGGTIALAIGFVLAMSAATKVWTAISTAAKIATTAWKVAQAALNFVMDANPIGLVIVAIAALVAGIIYAYHHSETFRRIVQAAFKSVSDAAKFMWNNVLKPTFSFIVRTWLAVAGFIIEGAAKAFGWVPGLGPKLRTAADKFNEFKDKVNKALDNVNDEGVNVKFKSTFTPPHGFSMHDIVGKRRGGLLPGYGGGDRIPILAEAGEAIVSKEATRRYAGVLGAMGVPGFARGGLIPNLSLFSAPGVTRTEGAIGHAIGARAANNMAQNFRLLIGGPLGTAGASGSLMSWIAQAIAITGVPGWWAPALARRAMFESGGNPRAINLWDSNAAAGHPSMGLMQTIASTFAAYAWDGLRNVWNPVHNLVAAIRYILSRYGSIAAIDPPVRGYDRGGMLMPGWTLAYNGTGRPERVGGGGDVHVHFHGDVYGDRQSITRTVRDGLKQQLRHEGKLALANQL